LSTGHAATVASHFELAAPQVTVRRLCATNIGTEIRMSDTNLTLTQRNGAKHRATPEAGIRLIYAGSATMSNDQKHVVADF